MARRTLLVAAAAALSGCAVTPPPPQPTDGRARLWSGRFSATYPDRDAQDGRGRTSGRFRLERRPRDELVLELASPLGQLVARARVGPDYAELQDARGETHRAQSADLLTERLFGWRIPVRALPGWLDPAEESIVTRDGKTARSQIDDTGAIARQHWSVRYPEAQGGRPKVLELGFPAHEPDPTRQLRLRLVIDSAN